MVDKKLIETYHFEVCEKHPDTVWANIGRWSTDCPLCDLEADWKYEIDNLNSEMEDVKSELETAQERVEELEDTVANTESALDDITRTLNHL